MRGFVPYNFGLLVFSTRRPLPKNGHRGGRYQEIENVWVGAGTRAWSGNSRLPLATDTGVHGDRPYNRCPAADRRRIEPETGTAKSPFLCSFLSGAESQKPAIHGNNLQYRCHGTIHGEKSIATIRPFQRRRGKICLLLSDPLAKPISPCSGPRNPWCAVVSLLSVGQRKAQGRSPVASYSRDVAFASL
jgi:hypothetical protein